MPPVLVYSVDFKNGNLAPHPANHAWGNMKQGATNPADHPESYGDSKGINLSVFRAPGTVAGVSATNSVNVFPGAGVLSVATRLLLRVEFDRPWAQQAFVPLSASNLQAQGPNTTGAGSPWAIGLGVKFGTANDAASDKRIPVTCQFNRTMNGIRLNTPGHLQKDVSTVLRSPLDYADYWPANTTNLFVLKFALCGLESAAVPAGKGYSVGSGTLEIGPNADQRVFSNAAFSDPGAQKWIDAMGVTLVTQDGVGQIMIRLRRFSVSVWQ